MGNFLVTDDHLSIEDLPSILSGDLRNRFHMASDLDWRNDYENLSWHWSRVADERFHAVSEFHPERTPLLRIGIKDNINCNGFTTRLGTKNYRHYPENSATVISNINNSYFTCKTQLTEVTLGRNAGCYNPKFNSGWPGASSTGSAVAVAANICDAAIGTDSLGSVRIPAAACGIVSLRMTYNPSIMQGILPVSVSFDSAGWFARSIDDLSFIFENLNLLPINGNCPSKYKIGISKEVINDKYCLDSIRESYEILLLNQEVKNIEFIPFSFTSMLWESRMDSWRLCAYEAHNELSFYSEKLDLASDVRNVLSLGSSVSEKKAFQIKSTLDQLRIQMEHLMKSLGIHAFILPAYPFNIPTPDEIESWDMLFPDFTNPDIEPLSGYAPIASMLGWPVLTIPVFMIKGQLKSKMQTAFQIVTLPYYENILLDIARTIQNV
ncbi:TPA: amidase family protein [Klebsiella variicola subsp. variicola]